GVRLGYRGELCLDHLVWLGARPYDPATRSFLAPDPLPNPPGAPCAANPYHYAWNDPVSLVDPSGLRPLTQDEFNQKKHAEELGHLGQAWEAIKKDPWGSVALGLTVAAGVGLLFVPGGQAIGAGILIGVAISSGAGIATGTFDPRLAAFNGVVGGITGGVGSALSGAGVATQVAVGAGLGGGGNIAQQEVFTGHVDWGQAALSAGVGGLGAGVGAKLAGAREVNTGGAPRPAPTGVPEPSTATPIWRGVAQGHHAYDAAAQGIALPGSEFGHINVVAHNLGATSDTALTSWSTDTSIAQQFAGKNGVILHTTVEDLQARGVNVLSSPDRFHESEILVQGRVEGLTVLRAPWPWSPR
ncbi:MAG: hypothetical protein JWM17_2780, partial [Actinobacteria bacterium]|nr:hypothetical protein [Actinomycetota bacterium]